MMSPTTVKFGSVFSELGPAGVRGFADVTTEWLHTKEYLIREFGHTGCTPRQTTRPGVASSACLAL